jgi:GntR family transcriptional regulator
MPQRGLIVINADLQDPVHLQVSGQIQALIESGELEPGTRLPTVRQLAHDLDIAPNTVMRAYGTLRDAGLIVSDGQRGTVVGRRRRPDHSREAALRSAVEATVESLRHRGFSAEQIAAAMAGVAAGLR